MGRKPVKQSFPDSIGSGSDTGNIRKRDFATAVFSADNAQRSVGSPTDQSIADLIEVAPWQNCLSAYVTPENKVGARTKLRTGESRCIAHEVRELYEQRDRKCW